MFNPLTAFSANQFKIYRFDILLMSWRVIFEMCKLSGTTTQRVLPEMHGGGKKWELIKHFKAKDINSTRSTVIVKDVRRYGSIRKLVWVFVLNGSGWKE